MSIETVLDIGTEGLTDKDRELLESLSELKSDEYDAPRTTSTQYGWVIWLGDEESMPDEIQDLKDRGASAYLIGVIKYAYKKEVFMINIDSDSTDDVWDA